MKMMSEKIERLLEDIQSKNLEELLSRFWQEVRKEGTPLIEPIDGSSHYLVTFIWKATGEHRNVVVTNYGLVSYDPQNNQMEHIPGTDVWYRSFVMPKGLRTAYNISIDDPLVRICDYRFEDLAGATFPFNFVLDPYNYSETYSIPSSLSLLGYEQTLSMLTLPDAPNDPWKQVLPTTYTSTLQMKHIPSRLLEEGRDVYVYCPPGYNPNREEPYHLLVTFDGFAFKEKMHGKEMLDYLITQGEMPPVVAIMVCNPEPNSVTRMRDLACNTKFTDFIAKELIPWVQQRWRVTTNRAKTIIAGCSMGGLAASFVALSYPEIFGNVLAQSPSLWWSVNQEKNWLITQFAERSCQNVKFYLEAGCLETAKTFQNGMNFLEVCEAFKDVLLSKGYEVSYEPFAGGHDYFCWESTFAKGVSYLLQKEESLL